MALGRLAVLTLLLGLATPALAGESLTLTTPVTAPSLTGYTIQRLTLDWQEPSIHIRLLGPNGETYSYAYTGAVAGTLLQSLNKVDLSTKSLQRRIFERLIADGVKAGTIAGVPD